MAGSPEAAQPRRVQAIAATRVRAQALAIGFGAWMRERTVGPLLAADPTALRVDAVTGLQRGRDEYDDTVVPFFRRLGLPSPRFFDELAAALAETGRGGAQDSDHAGGCRVALVGTPTTQHHDQIAAALDAGLHVYVERPVCGPGDDLPALVRIADHGGLVFFTGTQRRVEVVYRVLAATYRQHRSRGPTTVRCHLAAGHRPRGWRTRRRTAGGGVVVDSGYHLLDVATWLLSDPGSGGDQPVVTSADVVTRHDPAIVDDLADVETSAIGTVHLADGSTLHLDLSYLAPRGSVSESIELRDDAGASFGLFRQQARHNLAAGRLTCQDADGNVLIAHHDGREVPLWSADLGASGAPDRPLRDFVDLVTSGRSQPIGEPHPCAAALAVGTWELVRSIYAVARDEQMEGV